MYQDYEYFYLNNVKLQPARLVWDQAQQKIIVLSGTANNTYATNGSICQNLSSLASQYGYTLSKTFDQMIAEILGS